MKKLSFPIFVIALISSLMVFAGCDEESPTKPEIRDYEWKYLGLQGIDLWDIKLQKNKLYISGSGLWRIDLTSLRIDTLYKTQGSIFSFEVDVQNENFIIIGLYEGQEKNGVWKSVNGGLTWQNASQGLPDESNYVTKIKQDPLDPNNFYLHLKNSNGGIFKSSNKGESWNLISRDVTLVEVEDLEFSSKSDSAWLCGTNTGGIETPILFVSENRGQNWKLVSGNGLSLNLISYYDIELNHQNNSVFFLGTARGLFKTVNSGKDWERILNEELEDGFLNQVSKISINKKNSKQMLVFSRAVFYANDGGTSFEKIMLPEGQKFRIIKGEIDWDLKTFYVIIENKGVYKKNF